MLLLQKQKDKFIQQNKKNSSQANLNKLKWLRREENDKDKKVQKNLDIIIIYFMIFMIWELFFKSKWSSIAIKILLAEINTKKKFYIIVLINM